jgi:enoyl-[acyl-carrier protein] reductase III
MLVFKDKVVLVTGGSRGIGRAIAVKFGTLGAHVVINYRQNEAAARAVRELINGIGGSRAIIVKADQGQIEDVHHMFEIVRAEFGRLDFFISNAAATAYKPAIEVMEHNLEKTFDLTVKAFLIGTQDAVGLMQGHGGRIVAITGINTTRWARGYATLGAAKGAVETLVKYLACELASRGIVVNCVSPGFVETDSAIGYYGERYEVVKRSVAERTPLGRVGQPEDIANVVALLCTPEAGWISGQTIIADGGFSFPAHFDTEFPPDFGAPAAAWLRV